MAQNNNTAGKRMLKGDFGDLFIQLVISDIREGTTPR
jgi:hypothetical protein